MRFSKIIARSIALFLFASIAFVLTGTVNAKATDEYDDLEYIESNNTYYADSYFWQPSIEYNPHLATISMVFANSTGPSGDPKGISDTTWFINQSSRLKDFFDTIHYTDFDTNEDYKAPCDFDTIGVGAAKKEIGNGYTVVARAPRSAGYYREWANNIFLGTGENSDYMHEGWYNAANKLLSFLDEYITKYVNTPKVKIWLTGFSRGGATANIAAGILDDKLDKKIKPFTKNVEISHIDIYTYTFEAPQGANMNSKNRKLPHDSIYNNIFNIINPNDLVPKVAMYQFGFTRFGIDKYMPTKFYLQDNYNEAFRTNLFLLREILGETKANEMDPDLFSMYGLPIDFVAKGLTDLLLDGDFSVLQYDDTKRNYDANIAVMLVLEEVCKQLGSRATYANEVQPALKDALLKMMNYNYKFDTSKIMDSLPGLISGLIVGGIYYAATGSYTELIKVVDFVDSGIEIPNETFKDALKAIVPAIKYLARTYWNRPNEVISCAKYIKNIFQNHNTEVTLARIQAQDSFYIESYNTKHPDLEIELIPFMDNADYGRMVFNGFNDLGLYVGNTRKINIDGHLVGKSDVELCPSGYVAGYYSFATDEKMEIFFPLNQKYKITMKSYSKKPYHTFEFIAFKQYFSLTTNKDTRKLIHHFTDWTCFNSKRYTREISY